MRVLHVFKIYFPEIFGGVQKAIFDISERSIEKSINSRVFALSEQPNPVPFKVGRHEAITVRQQLNVASTGMSLPAFATFRREAAWADLLHYHFPWPFMDLLHLWERPKKPCIVTYHSDIVKQTGLLQLYRPLMHRFLGSMDAIVATSPNYVESSAILREYPSKTTVIPLGIDRDELVPEPERVTYWRKRVGEGFFLFLGALRYYKGLPVLLESARLTGLPVVIGGTGDGSEALQASAPKNVHFIGHYSDQDRAALFSLARAFVFPSNQRSEAFGISLLEGARASLPLVCCELGTGTTYVNQHERTGLVVPPNDREALSTAMQRLSKDPDLAKRLGAGARARFVEKFTVDRMADAYSELYRRVGA